MHILVFQNDDGIQLVHSIEHAATEGAIAIADKIVRDYVNENCEDVDVDFEPGDGNTKRGLWKGTWAIGSEGEYFELWEESTVH